MIHEGRAPRLPWTWENEVTCHRKRLALERFILFQWEQCLSPDFWHHSLPKRVSVLADACWARNIAATTLHNYLPWPGWWLGSLPALPASRRAQPAQPPGCEVRAVIKKPYRHRGELFLSSSESLKWITRSTAGECQVLIGGGTPRLTVLSSEISLNHSKEMYQTRDELSALHESIRES